MNMKRSFVLLASIVAVSASNLIAAEKKMGKEMRDMPKMDGKMDPKMMEAMKFGTPGENHKVLDILVGNWTHAARSWMAPDAKPEESKGTSTNKWILGGRFLQSDVKGNMMGMPFEGLGMMGYDNMKGVYQGLWMDNMMTGIMSSTAQYDAATKTFNESGSFSCPMTGEKNMSFRAVWKIIDANSYTYEMFQKDPDGKEFKMIEIAYSRVK